MSALEQLTKIPLQNKIAILVGVVVLVAVGYYFTYYSSTADDLVSAQGKERTLKKDLRDAEKRKSSYLADQLRRDDLRKTYAQQLRALPPETEMSSFLNNLNTQAELVGMDIKSVTPLAEEPADYYARIPVELELRGSYHQLAKFFYLVGNLERVINIEDISLEIDKTTDTGPLLAVNVMATTFRSLNENDKAEGKGKSKRKRRKH